MRTLLSLASLASTVAAGLLGLVAIRVFGPYLAMGLQIWAGNTEPAQPRLPWPYAATFVALMLPVPFLYRRQWAIASVAALPLVLLPLGQLWRLYEAAGAP